MIVGGTGVLSMEVGIFAKLAVLRSKSKNAGLGIWIMSNRELLFQ
jgi:hypothetical protein